MGTQKSAKTPPAVGKMIRPFHNMNFNAKGTVWSGQNNSDSK